MSRIYGCRLHSPVAADEQQPLGSRESAQRQASDEVAVLPLDDIAGGVTSFNFHAQYRAQALPAVVAGTDIAQVDAARDSPVVGVFGGRVALLGTTVRQQTFGFAEQRGLRALEAKDVVETVVSDVLRVVLRAGSGIVSDHARIGPSDRRPPPPRRARSAKMPISLVKAGSGVRCR